jgi:hypothetical protein
MKAQYDGDDDDNNDDEYSWRWMGNLGLRTITNPNFEISKKND